MTAMNFDDVILGRRSIRGYLNKPVPKALVREVHLGDDLLDWITRLVRATRPGEGAPQAVRDFLRLELAELAQVAGPAGVAPAAYPGGGVGRVPAGAVLEEVAGVVHHDVLHQQGAARQVGGRQQPAL